MASTPLKYLNQYITTTLSVVGGIDASQTTGIVIQSSTGLETTKPGIALFSYADPLNTTNAEWISYTAITANELQGVTRGAEGGSGKVHANGVTIAFPLSESHINNLNAMFDTTGLDIAQIATPANPDSGRNKLYFKSDEKIYKLTSAGVETEVGASIISTAKYAPQGFLINGKIVPSVASNNLTVAIKGMDGNDPSASNPVYCRIGDTVRTITSALSVTKNAGTNWFNAGGAELAAKEIDYFVYLGYNATDGVTVGFSRIPFAQQYDEFSSTSTNERYCAISTITNAAAGDDYENIGRFAATLSAGAGYTWTVSTFTTINLVQRPVFETRWLNFTPTLVWTAGAAPSSPVTANYYTNKYKIRNSSLIISFYQNYTAGTTVTQVTATMPFTGKISVADELYPIRSMLANVSAPVTTYSQYYSGDNKVYSYCSSNTVDRFSINGEYEI